MKKEIIFFTGARSEYGILKSLIAYLEADDSFEVSLYVSGLHFLQDFGYTIDEIKSDSFNIKREINVFSKEREPNETEFSTIITRIAAFLREDKPYAFFVIGDRIESYAAALASHFAKVPIIHAGGGNLTKGANDNIYRYNITNLADFHLATSKNNYDRLREISLIEDKNIFFTGSFAIDSIFKFKKQTKSIDEFIPKLEGKDFCLMTFHSATKSNEDISSIMDFSINYIIEKGLNILLTYPNNDEGYQPIIEIIKKWKNHQQVYVKEHLGAIGYYSALNETKFVIGNSSSGLIEAPYFHKPVINIGSRQEGRDCDDGVMTVECFINDVRRAIDCIFESNFEKIKNNNLFGSGNAISAAVAVLKKIV